MSISRVSKIKEFGGLLRTRLGLSFILALLLLAPLSTPLGAAETFTLGSAVDYGLEHSPGLQAVALEIDKSQSGIRAAGGVFMPQLSVGLGYTRLESLTVDGPTDVDYLNQSTTSATLRLSQTIFSGFRNLSSYQRAQLEKEYAEIQYKLRVQAVIHSIQMSFIQLLQARHEVKAFAEAVKRSRSSVKAAKALFAKKLIPYADLLQTEVDLEEAVQLHIKAQHVVEKSRLNLNFALGLPRSVSARYVGELKILPIVAGLTLDDALVQARTRRLELAGLKNLIVIAGKDAQIARSHYYPQVVCDVSYIDYTRDYRDEAEMGGGMTYDRDQTNTYLIGAINLQWNLFDGGTSYHNMKRHEFEQQRLKCQIEEVELEIAAQVETAYIAIDDARHRIASAAKARIAAREFFARESERLRIGIGVMPRLLDAQARLARAEANYHQAYGDCQIGRADLYYAMGQSLPELNPYIPNP